MMDAFGVWKIRILMLNGQPFVFGMKCMDGVLGRTGQRSSGAVYDPPVHNPFQKFGFCKRLPCSPSSTCWLALIENATLS